MTKEEKIKQKEEKKALNRLFKIDRQIAHDLALEETVAFHAKSIEKILRKEMPKGWKMKMTVELLDSNDNPFCCQEIGHGRITCQIESSARFVLSELLDKHNINYHIQNIESHD